jgi:hypothetical protein
MRLNSPRSDEPGLQQDARALLLSDQEDAIDEKNRSLAKGAFVANAALCGGVLFFSFALLYASFLSSLEELQWKLMYSAISK